MKKKVWLSVFVGIAVCLLLIAGYAHVRSLPDVNVKISPACENTNHLFKVITIGDKIYGDNETSIFQLNKDFTVEKVLWRGQNIAKGSEIPFVASGTYLIKIVSFGNTLPECRQKLLKIDTKTGKISIFPLPDGFSVFPSTNGPNFSKRISAVDNFLFIDAGEKFLIYNCKTNAFKSFSLPFYIETFCVKEKQSSGSKEKVFSVYAVVWATDFYAFIDGSITMRGSKFYTNEKLLWFNDQNGVSDTWRIMCDPNNSDKVEIIEKFSGGPYLIRSFSVGQAYENSGILTVRNIISCEGEYQSFFNSDMTLSGNLLLISGYEKNGRDSTASKLLVVNLPIEKRFSIKQSVCKFVDFRGNDKVLTLTPLRNSNGKAEFVATGEKYIYKISVVKNGRNRTMP